MLLLRKKLVEETRELKVVLDKDKMAENGVDALSIMQMIQTNNGSSQSGSFVSNDTEYLVTTGKFYPLQKMLKIWWLV